MKFMKYASLFFFFLVSEAVGVIPVFGEVVRLTTMDLQLIAAFYLRIFYALGLTILSILSMVSL